MDGRDEVEVSCMIAKARRGEGLVTEAAKAIVEYAYSSQGLDRHAPGTCVRG